MAVIYSYGPEGLDMTAEQLPASAFDFNSVVLHEYTNQKLSFQVDVLGTTIGAEYIGYEFLYDADPQVLEFRLFDSWWDTKVLVGGFNYSLSQLNSLIANGLDSPEMLSGSDEIYGDSGDDILVGFRGADDMWGDAGDDIIRAGNGRDEIWGDEGSDFLFGGFGKNTFLWEDDGAVDELYLKSDQHAYNWVYDSSGNSPNGEKADIIYELDPFDRIYVQGVSTDQLSFGAVSGGIGIFARGTLEATYIGDDLSQDQISQMTFGALA